MFFPGLLSAMVFNDKSCLQSLLQYQQCIISLQLFLTFISLEFRSLPYYSQVKTGILAPDSVSADGVQRGIHIFFFPVVFDCNRVNIVKMLLSCQTTIIVLLVNNSILLLRPFCLSHFCLQIVDFSRAQSIYIQSKNKTQGTHLHVMTQIVRSLNSLCSFLHHSAPLNVDLCIISRVYSCTQCDESEKAMAPHSSTLAWKIPWTEEPGRLQSMGSLRVRHD